MPKGGKRPGAGRKKSFRPPVEANKRIATEVLGMAARPIGHGDKCSCEKCLWFGLLTSTDERVRLDTLKYLTDRRDGKAVHTVNHLHDKPIVHEVNISLSEALQKARKRVAGMLSLLEGKQA